MTRPRFRFNCSLAFLACIALAASTPNIASAQVDATLSYFVPQAGPAATPVLGAPAVRFFRGCPNNDGGASLPNNMRLRVVLMDAMGLPVAGLTPYVKFNTGTPAQGFAGNGADSVIASAAMNPANGCPTLPEIFADFPTLADGSTVITFVGAGGVRDAARKWGHYDSNIPLYVVDATGEVPIFGKLLETDPGPPGGYVLRIKSLDWTGGLGPTLNQGEQLTIIDFNPVVNGIGASNAVSYWWDFNWSGSVDVTDINIIAPHLAHDCNSPFNP